MRRFLIFATCTVLCTAARGQRLNPGDYIYPIQQVAGLYSANFGELRPGHFHAGVDIKTDGVEGKPLVAVADGYISRIVLTPSGYGRGIYLTLSNGTTAVYGHLQLFRKDIEEYVRAERYRSRSNNLDRSFEPAQWPVRQGDLIGYSGNSGSSMGPHLHFELRDTPTQKVLNIVREGVIRPNDDMPPRILKIHYVEIDSIAADGVCLRAAPQSYAVLRGTDGRYRLTRDEGVEVGRKGYFIAEVSDRRNGVNNTFGVWRVAASLDQKPIFEYRMDGFTHDLSRHCDAVSSYALQRDSRNEAIRLAQMEGAPACFYPTLEERGMVRCEEGQRRRLCIEAEDDMGNLSQIEFDIHGRTGRFRGEADSTATLLHRTRAQSVSLGREASMQLPAGALYESLYCRPQSAPAPAADSGLVVLSPAYRFLDEDTPLRYPASVSIRAEVHPRLQLRTVLAARTSKGKLTCVGGTYSDNAVTATTRTTGPLAIVADTLPPRILPLFKQGADLSGVPSLRFRVNDNFSDIATCTLLLDGQWVPCDRLPVQGVAFHLFDAPATRNRHHAQLTVTDGCGNTTRWEGSFYR